MTYFRSEDRTDDRRAHAYALSPLGTPTPDLSPAARWLWDELAFVWLDFEHRLAAVPVIARLDAGTITLDDYRELLVNLRQQVIEGGRWIALAASSMSIELFPVRSLLIGHAAEEHRDYQMLEDDYVSVGGDRSRILTQAKNIGSEAFSSYMFHQAAQPDPLHLFGAMFIIEGLGSAKAAGWAKTLKDALGLDDSQVSFLEYHGANDDSHYDKLRSILSHPLIDQSLAERLARTARIVARLYALQLEELGT
jgi:3-oxoacyl-[acyl-carrier-protein] synthase-3